MDVRGGKTGRGSSTLRNSIMWKRERATMSPLAASSFSIGHVADDVIGAPRRLLRPGARGVSRFRRTVIRSRSSQKIDGSRRGGLLGAAGIQIGAVVGEQADEILPSLAVEAFRPGGKGLLDVTERVAPVAPPPRSAVAAALLPATLLHGLILLAIGSLRWVSAHLLDWFWHRLLGSAITWGPGRHCGGTSPMRRLL